MTAILRLGYLAAVSIIIAVLTARHLGERLRVLLIGFPLSQAAPLQCTLRSPGSGLSNQ